jgi:hypothetical protein
MKNEIDDSLKEEYKKRFLTGAIQNPWEWSSNCVD